MTCAGTVGNDITGGIEHSLCRPVITCLILIMLMGSSVGVGQLPPVAGFQIHQRLWVVVSVSFFQVSYCRRIENSIRRESVLADRVT